MDYHNALESAWLNGYKQGRESVEKSGPIDVAIVTRCKDCKYYEIGVEYYTGGPDVGTKDICRLLHRQMQDDDFCSYGERRTG